MVNKVDVMEMLKNSGIDLILSDKDFDLPFKDIGLDSLDVFGLLTEVEKMMQKSISEEDYLDIKTLNDVINLIND